VVKRPGDVSNWDLLRTFYLCAPFDSFSKAAEHLKCAPGKLTRQMDRLEMDMGGPLFVRSNRGFTLTPEGRKVFDEVTRFQDSLLRIGNWITKSNMPEHRTINFACTEGLASYWLSNFIKPFQDENPSISLNMRTETMIAEDKRPTFDAQLQAFRPADPFTEAKRMGVMHFMPFASRTYLDEHPSPVNKESLGEHHWIDYVPYSVEKGGWSNWFSDPELRHQSSVITNSTAMTVHAVSRGAGIGMLPTYFSILDADLVPLNFGPYFSYPIWLNAGAKGVMQWHVRALSNFLNRVIDPAAMPWFQDELVLPEEFPRAVEKLSPMIKTALSRAANGPTSSARIMH
jgi:DNA-binding transcriptional LysR family regulator